MKGFGEMGLEEEVIVLVWRKGDDDDLREEEEEVKEEGVRRDFVEENAMAMECGLIRGIVIVVVMSRSSF